MEITVNIKAEGLEGAIHTLAQVLANYEMPVKQRDCEEVQAKQPDQPQQQAPVQQKQPDPQPQTQQPAQQAPAQQAVPTQKPQQAPAQQVQPAQQQAVPTSSVEYSMDQLAKAATQLMDAGKQQELVALLSEFGVQALTALPQEQYGAFATKLREKGAKI